MVGSLAFCPSRERCGIAPTAGFPVNRFAGEPDFNEDDTTLYSVGYLFEHQANDIWTFRQNARYDNYENDTQRVFGFGLDPDDPTQRTVLRGAQAFETTIDGFHLGTQAQAKFATGPLAHTLLVGVDYQDFEFAFPGFFGNAPPLDIFDPVYGAPVSRLTIRTGSSTDASQVGLYLQEQLKLYDRWVVALGGRQDWAGATVEDLDSGERIELDDSEFSGHVGLVYLAHNGLAPYASYAESFEPVRSANSDGTAFQPELGQQVEIGLRYEPPGSNVSTSPCS